MLKIRKLKRLWQVTNDKGHTLANCNTEKEALVFKEFYKDNPFPFSSLNIGTELVSQTRGQTMKKISIYP